MIKARHKTGLNIEVGSFQQLNQRPFDQRVALPCLHQVWLCNNNQSHSQRYRQESDRLKHLIVMSSIKYIKNQLKYIKYIKCQVWLCNYNQSQSEGSARNKYNYKDKYKDTKRSSGLIVQLQSEPLKEICKKAIGLKHLIVISSIKYIKYQLKYIKWHVWLCNYNQSHSERTARKRSAWTPDCHNDDVFYHMVMTNTNTNTNKKTKTQEDHQVWLCNYNQSHSERSARKRSLQTPDCHLDNQCQTVLIGRFILVFYAGGREWTKSSNVCLRIHFCWKYNGAQVWTNCPSVHDQPYWWLDTPVGGSWRWWLGGGVANLWPQVIYGYRSARMIGFLVYCQMRLVSTVVYWYTVDLSAF